jgi:endo-1,4-beta-mannosidase
VAAPQGGEAGGTGAYSERVYRDGARLMLKGAPFRFMGVNTYYLAGYASEHGAREDCDFTEPEHGDAELENYFEGTRALGINAVRFWAFQGFAGPTGDDFSFLERLIEEARLADVYLIPVLIDKWDHCQRIGQLGDAFFTGDYKKPQSPHPLSYLDYVDRVTRRFANEPRILMWQMGNELASENRTADVVKAVKQFACETSALIKENDPGSLVSFGTIGDNQSGTGGWQLDWYRGIHQCPGIDVVEHHDYNDDGAAPTPIQLSNLAVALELNKPFFVGEMGMKVSEPYANWVKLYDAKLKAALELGVAGHVVWHFSPHRDKPEGFNFGYQPDDPIANVVRDYAERFAAPYPQTIEQAAGTCGVLNERCTVSSQCCKGLSCRAIVDPQNRLGVRSCQTL